MTEKNDVAPLWRGALGGVAGGILGPLVFYIFSTNPASSYRLLTLVSSVIYLLFVVVSGIAVGMIIWLLSPAGKARIGVILRTVIGAVCGGLLGLISAYLLYVSQDAAAPGIKFSVYSIVPKLGMIIGGAAGISARPAIGKD
jgi:uncharacterized membrane protein